MIKRPDIAGFLSAILVILWAVPSIHWKCCAVQFELVPPERVYIAFYMPGVKLLEGYFSVIASMAYFQKGAPDRPATVIHESVSVRFKGAKQRCTYLFRWQHFVTGGDSMIRYDTEPTLETAMDARPLVLKDQEVAHHFTWFVPRTEITQSDKCNVRENFLTRPSETQFLSDLTEMAFTFKVQLEDGPTLKSTCKVTLDDAGRQSLSGKTHVLLSTGDDANTGRRDVVRFLVPCVPLHPKVRDLRTAHFPTYP